MNKTFEKLNVKDLKNILVVNAPKSFAPELAALRGVTVVRSLSEAGNIEFSLTFVTKQKEVDELARAIAKRPRTTPSYGLHIRREHRSDLKKKSIAIMDGKF